MTARLRELNLHRLTIAAILVVTVAFGVVSPAYAQPSQPPHPTPPAPRHERPASSLATGDVLHITSTSGTAFNITNRSDQKPATLDLMVKVDKDSPGRARLDVLSGTVTVGSETFTIKSGKGIINFHSHKVHIQVRIDDGEGKQSHLELFGKVSGLPSRLPVGGSFTINFEKAQSKLANKWFLHFNTTVTRTS